MALDTREKRASALSALGVMLHLPLPDGTVGVQDRPQVTWIYAGIVYAAPGITISVSRSRFSAGLYDKNGDLKYFFRKIDTLSWDYNRIGGCGQADLNILLKGKSGIDLTVAPQDELRIVINDELRYSGKYIKRTRKITRGLESLKFLFYGYLTELDDIIVRETFVGMEVSQIVMSILDDYIVGVKNLTYGAADIVDTGYTVQSIVFNHSVKDAINLLAGLGGNVEWGVDRNKKVFFKQTNKVIRRSYKIGKDVNDYEEIEDIEQVKNELFVFGSDGTEPLSTIDAFGSSTIYGVKQANLFESSITAPSDASRLGAVILKKQSGRQRQIKMAVLKSDEFVERDTPLGAAALLFPSVGLKNKYGHNIRYGRNNKYGNMRADQISTIKYSLVGGALAIQEVLENEIPSVGTQQNRIEFELKDLQRR